MAANLFGAHGRIAKDFTLLEAVGLERPGPSHPLPDDRCRFPPCLCRHVSIPKGRDLDVDIDAVQEGARNPAEIPLDLTRSAATFSLGISQISAWAWVHGCCQHEGRRIGERSDRSRDGHLPVFERLTEHLEDVPFEFQDFI